jgi:hypothetical protein
MNTAVLYGSLNSSSYVATAAVNFDMVSLLQGITVISVVCFPT